jgi:hypothetical protein
VLRGGLRGGDLVGGRLRTLWGVGLFWEESKVVCASVDVRLLVVRSVNGLRCERDIGDVC